MSGVWGASTAAVVRLPSPPERAVKTGGPCIIDGCDRVAQRTGMCRPHYERKRRGRSMDIPSTRYPVRPVVDRFWEKVEKTDTCWLWTGTLCAGYGRFYLSPSHRVALAHRVAYELVVGPIPEGLTLDHVKAWGCTNRNCVNPSHLEPVENAENTRRTRHTHCRRGHLRVEGDKQCLICKRDQQAWARLARQKGATR